MRSIFRLAVAVGLVASIAACSTSNVSQDPNPDWKEGSSFSVRTEPGTGTFVPVLDVKPDATGVTVTVNAQDAEGVSAAYVHVAYDAARYAPESVNIGDFLGGDGEVVSLAITDLSGNVPVGVAQIKSAGVMPRYGNGTLATIRFRNGAAGLRTVSAKSPDGTANTVDDLFIVNQGATSADLQWTEKNTGDYDNNGEVGISDLTPVGLFFGQQVATAQNPDHARLVDGDRNGEINIADITPIGSNLGHVMTGYIVYTDAEGSQQLGNGITVLRADQNVSNDHAVVYNHTAVYDPTDSPTFSVRPVAADDTSNPGPVSNAAVVLNEDGPPLAPTNLIADASAIIGPTNIKLTWTLSGFTSVYDVANYEIERKLSSEDDTAWVQITDKNVSGQTNTFTDTGLAEVSYDYRVWAVDKTDLKSASPSNTATQTPFIVVVSPPENLTAVTGGGSHSVTLEFDQPADGTAKFYKIFRQAPGEPGFTELAGGTGSFLVGGSHKSYIDSACTAGESYSYYVIGLDASQVIESAPSATASAVASLDAPPISIISLTTDKTTHLNTGAEAAANLTVTTDVPADSVVWTASAGGNPTGTGNTATWKPTGNPSGPITITCEVTNAAGTDSATIDMYITTSPIQTSYQQRGGGPVVQVGDPLGSGHFMNWSYSGMKRLEPLTDGGAINDASGNFVDDVAGKVILWDRWELWCGPCKAEFPELDDYAEHFRPYGYMQISCSSDPAPYDITDIKVWFEANNIDFVTNIHDYAGGGEFDSAFLALGYDYYIPFNVLFDRDGYARRIGGAAIGWDSLIAELTGGPGM